MNFVMKECQIHNLRNSMKTNEILYQKELKQLKKIEELLKKINQVFDKNYK